MVRARGIEKTMINETIHVYINISGKDHHVGVLQVEHNETEPNEKKRKVWEFRYSNSWLNNPLKFSISPGIDLEKGYIQVPYNEMPFIIEDTCPDSWGQNLIKKDPEVKKILADATNRNNREIPYTAMILVNTTDFARQGALRFSYSDENPIFEKPEDKNSIPHIKELKEISKDVRAVSENIATIDQFQKIRHTSTPMGGAQPKACFIGENGKLLMAKFYKCENTDDYAKEDEMVAKVDKIKLEAITVKLMEQLNFDVPNCEFIKHDPNDNATSAIITERFDRDENGNRIHFMSAATLVHEHFRTTKGKSLNSEEVLYYTFIADAIRHFKKTDNSLLPELWRRMLIHVMLENYDNHLKNQAYIYNTTTQQWEHAKCYDVNPSLTSDGWPAMRISENHREMTIENAIAISEAFDVSKEEAQNIAIEMAQHITKNWKEIAKSTPFHATDEEIKIYSRPFQKVIKYYETHINNDNPNNPDTPEKPKKNRQRIKNNGGWGR